MLRFPLLLGCVLQRYHESRLAKREQQVVKYVPSFVLRLADTLLIQYAITVVRRVFLRGITTLHV